MKRFIVLLTAFCLAVTGGAAIAQWDGVPTAPQRASIHSEFQNFSLGFYNSHQDKWYVSPVMQAGHGTACQGPPSTHAISNPLDVHYVCNEHLMSAINGLDGYAAAYITPNKLLDFSAGPAVFQFEMSTQQDSGRDWVDVMVMPYLDNSFSWQEAGAQFNPKEGIQAILQGQWNLKRISNFATQNIEVDFFPKLMEQVNTGVNQAAQRQLFKLTVSTTHARMEMMASATNTCAGSCVFFDRDIPVLPFSQAVVTIGHHSYNPTKDNAGIPATWHFDELTLTPSLPITVIHPQDTSRRIVPSTPGGSDMDVHFAAPAPANSYLRVNAVGFVEMSFNGGASWTAGRDVTPPTAATEPHTFFTAIPAGVQDVRFRLSGPHINGQRHASDFSIWSLNGGSPPSTPTSALATSTVTSVPPTITLTPPLSTATPVATSTSVPSPTASPVPTATPSTATYCLVWPGATGALNAAGNRVKITGIPRPLSECP